MWRSGDCGKEQDSEVINVQVNFTKGGDSILGAFSCKPCERSCKMSNKSLGQLSHRICLNVAS